MLRCLPILILLNILIFSNYYHIVSSQKVEFQSKQAPIVEDSTITFPSTWKMRGGYWDFSDKIIKAQGYYGFNKAYLADISYKNFIYEVKVLKQSENGQFGLLFRYNENQDKGYGFFCWPYGGCRFELIASGQEKLKFYPVHECANKITGYNIWNSIKIVAKNARFEIFINGHSAETIIDSTFSSGTVGLVVTGDPRQKALFEIINIESLD